MIFPLPHPMVRALEIAADAAAHGGIPVGAVISYQDEIIAEASNPAPGHFDPTAHAEILAIRRAAERLGQDRLNGCDLWVTLEPCAMCAGAIAIARISRLYYGAEDPKGGAVAHGGRIFSQKTCHHRPDIYSGIGANESAALLRSFFTGRR